MPALNSLCLQSLQQKPANYLMTHNSHLFFLFILLNISILWKTCLTVFMFYWVSNFYMPWFKKQMQYSAKEKKQFKKNLTLSFPCQGGGIKIIDGRFGQPVYPFSPSTNRIALLPENFLVAGSTQPISRRDFLTLLANLTGVMVRASYSTEPSAVYR